MIFLAVKNAEYAKKDDAMTERDVGNLFNGKGHKENGLKTLFDLCVLCG